MGQLKQLFQPGKIGTVEVKNRLVMLAMGTHTVVDDVPTPRWRDFYVARARGGVGLMIVPLNCLPTAASRRGELPGIYDDRAMPGLCELVEIAHGYGAKIAAHFVNDTRFPVADDGLEHVGPSPLPASRHHPEVRALTVEEIQNLVARYAEGTRRAKEAGFDLVEYHFGMGQLINRFISSATNSRNDEYGGSLARRLRLPLEIIAAARRQMGPEFPLICRLSADEFLPGGHTLIETAQVAPLLVNAGLQALNVQAGAHEASIPLVDMSVPRGAFVYLAEAVKQMVDVPVIATYRINDPILADRVVAEGRADFVGMARALLADPDLPKKAEEGRFDDIRPCLACCLCIDRVVAGHDIISCGINPSAGHEGEYVVERTEQPKKVFVVGGGPAGMEVAQVAAQKGHDVTLFDRGDRLGGQLLVAAEPPHKEEIAGFVQYLSAQVSKSGAEVRLGREVDEEEIVAGRPDVVVIATGATPLIPNIPGVAGSNVVSAIDVLKRSSPVGKRVLVIGGGLVGCETALFLAQSGRQVTILEMLSRIGADIGPSTRWVMLKELAKAGVEVRAKATVARITESGVEVSLDNGSELITGDTVVMAVGLRSSNELYEKLKDRLPAVHAIGDCVRPRRLAEAIEEAFAVARLL